MLSTGTNLLPEFTHHGGVIILDFPLKQFGAVGLMIQTIFKLVWQRALERRLIAKYPLPNFLFADEAQLFVCRSDPAFQTTARSARCATVLLTQNIGGLSAALGKPATDTLVANLTTKFIHSNTDVSTNEWCSHLLAKTYQHTFSSGVSTSEADSGRATKSHNTGGHESLQHQVLPIEFCSNLRKGGPENNWCVDAFVFEGGRQWKASGRNYLRVTFKQH
jgi:hypothetical protein